MKARWRANVRTEAAPVAKMGVTTQPIDDPGGGRVILGIAPLFVRRPARLRLPAGPPQQGAAPRPAAWRPVRQRTPHRLELAARRPRRRRLPTTLPRPAR